MYNIFQTRYMEALNCLVTSMEGSIDSLIKATEQLQAAVMPTFKAGAEKENKEKAEEPDAQLVETLTALVSKVKIAWAEEGEEKAKECEEGPQMVAKQVASALQASYFTSFSELKNVLKMKTDYWSDLKGE